MDQDLKELLSALNEHRVKYLVIGGYAIGVHAEPRATKDLDIFIKADEENAVAVFHALAAYGAPLSGYKPADFNDGGSWFQMGNLRFELTFSSRSMESISMKRGTVGSRRGSTANSRPMSFQGSI